MVVDWSKDIETTSCIGAKPFDPGNKRLWPDGEGQYHVVYGDEETLVFINEDGTPWGTGSVTIRNTIAEITPPIPAPIAERMRGLIERMAAYSGRQHLTEMLIATEEARAIMAELAPVDPDAAEAKALYEPLMDDNHASIEDFLLKAIKRGRELEREGRK